MKIESWAPLFFVAAAASSLLGCKSHLDEAKIEASINDALKAEEVTLKSVKCPDDRPIKQGDKFECTGVMPEGGNVTFHVEQKDDKGNIAWKLDGALINQAKFGHKLESTLKGSVVTCPAKIVVLKKGDKFTCDYKHEGETGKVDITAKDNEGNVETSTHT